MTFLLNSMNPGSARLLLSLRLQMILAEEARQWQH